MQRLARAGADVVVEERQHELEADQERQRRDHDGAGRHQLVRRRGPPMIEAEHQAEQEQRAAGDKLQRGQRQIAEEIAIEDPPRRVAQVARQEWSELVRHAQVRDLVAIGRAHRKFHDLGADQAEMKQQVRLEEEAFGDTFVIEQFGDTRMDRKEAVGRIHDGPVAAGDFCEERQCEIAEAPHRRHRGRIGQEEEAVALDVVGLPARDRVDQRRHLLRVHLAVSIDLDDDVGAAPDGVAHAREERSPNALVDVMHQHHDALVGAFVGDAHAGAFRAAVVDHDDQLDLGSDGLDHGKDLAAAR